MNNVNNQAQEINMDDIKSEASKYVHSANSTENVTYHKDCFHRIAVHIASLDGVEIKTVYLGLSEIIQTGGHTRNVTIRTARVGEWEISKKRLISIMNSMRINCTIRAMAKANRDLIAEISKLRNIPGNLYQQYKTYNPQVISLPENQQLEHYIYATDFQKDNPKAPTEVIKFLNQREIVKNDKRKK